MANTSIYGQIQPWDLVGGFERGYLKGKKGVAGRMAADGDYTGAARTLYPVAPEEAKGYLDTGYAMDERARVAQERQNRVGLAQAYGAGDYAGALKSAGDLGDVSTVAAVKKAQEDQRVDVYKRQISDAYSAATRLGALDPQRRQMGWDALISYGRKAMKDAGHSDQMFDILQGEYSDDKAAELAKALTEAGKVYGLDLSPKAKYQYQDGGNIIYQLDGNTGEIVARLPKGASPSVIVQAGARGEDRADKLTGQFRDDFRAEPVVKNYTEIQSVFGRSKAYVDRARTSGGAPLGDIGLVYAMAKINDPTSVVREQEFATTAQAGGFGDRVRNLYSTAVGRGFDQKTREALWKEIESAYGAYRGTFGDLQNRYRASAARYGVNPQDIFLSADAAPDAPTAPLGGAFDQLPNPAQYKDKTIRDQATGKRYRSDGRQWIEAP